MKEGENSNAMYWVQSGTLRLFKKKGTGFIELAVVHSGEVVGEMSFLDSQPRSASVEALQPCDIVEIPRGKFEEFINAQPSWMKSLIQTLVKRLRTTSNRVRELENASTVYSRDDDGRTTKTHEFLSTAEILKLCSALLLAHSRNSEKLADGNQKVKAGWLQFYASQILNVQLSKIQVFTDTLHEGKLIRIDKQKEGVDIYIQDVDRLEKFIYWLHEENIKPDEKQLPLTLKGMAILEAVYEHAGLSTLPPGSETHEVDMNMIFQKAAAEKNVKFPFEMASFDEVVKCGFAQDIRAAGEAKTAVFQVQRFLKLYPHISLRQRIREINAQKRG